MAACMHAILIFRFETHSNQWVQTISHKAIGLYNLYDREYPLGGAFVFCMRGLERRWIKDRIRNHDWRSRNL